MTEYLATNIAARIVNFFGELWALVVGKMPSGAWETSHGDSFIVVLWFCCFVVMQAKKAPMNIRQELLRQVATAAMAYAVYGDDSALAQDASEVWMYCNMHLFARWCKVYLGVTLRDIRVKIPFLSDFLGGQIKKNGLVYLKQRFVHNYKHGVGKQAKYLPIRPMEEYVSKAVWGREPKSRDVFDFTLSIMGHAYGTHGSNTFAYMWLKNAFKHCLPHMEGQGISMAQLIGRADPDAQEMKKFRLAGITLDTIKGGFPTMQDLTERNEFDEVYHMESQSDALEELIL